MISGRNTYHCAGQSVPIEKNALIFSNLQAPYHWEQHGQEQSGMFCLFTEAFLHPLPTRALAEHPEYGPGREVVFQLTDAQYQPLDSMVTELESSYAFEYDV